jgi:hypothetical protein
MNEIWIRDQFQVSKAQAVELGPEVVRISALEIRKAIQSIGKNKAHSTDGIMDIIFQKETWKKLKLWGSSPYMEY